MQPVEADGQCLRGPMYVECGSGTDEKACMEDLHDGWLKIDAGS